MKQGSYKMILNYRVELCRACYYKRTSQCKMSDDYIQNKQINWLMEGGECLSFKTTPWLVLKP